MTYQKKIPLGNLESLVIEWDSDWSNLTIRKDNKLVCSIPEKADLQIGKQFKLSDGRAFMVLLNEHGLEVWHDGRELVSGTRNGQVDWFGRAVTALLWLGAFQAIVAGIALLICKLLPDQLTAGAFLIIGGFFIGLSIWARRTGDKSPFRLSIVLASVTAVVALFLFTVLASVIVTPFISLIYCLIEGIKADPPRLTRKKNMELDAPLDSDL